MTTQDSMTQLTEFQKLYREHCGSLGKNIDNCLMATAEMMNTLTTSSGEYRSLSKKVAMALPAGVHKEHSSFVVTLWGLLIGSREQHVELIKYILYIINDTDVRAQEIAKFLKHMMNQYGDKFDQICKLDFVEVDDDSRTHIARELFTECDSMVTSNMRDYCRNKIINYVFSNDDNKRIQAVWAENAKLTEKVASLTTTNIECVEALKFRVKDIARLSTDVDNYRVCLDAANVKIAELEAKQSSTDSVTELKKKYEELEASTKKNANIANAKIVELEKLNKNLNRRLGNAYEVLKKNNEDTERAMKDINDGTMSIVYHGPNRFIYSYF